MKSNVDLERQIKDWANDVADQIPAWNADRLAFEQRPTRRRWPLLAAAAWCAVVGGVALYATDGGLDRTDPADYGVVPTAVPTESLPVAYERVEFRVNVVDITCDGALLSGSVVSAAPITYEAWADERSALWKNVVTYPNGDTRQAVAVGDPFYPTEFHLGGAEPSLRIGCEYPADQAVLATEPSQTALFSLNPLTQVPTLTAPGGDQRPMVDGYQIDSLRVGSSTDSRGRACTVWRRESNSFNGLMQALNQTTDWCVDEATGKVLEQTDTSSLETVGTVVTTRTLVNDEPQTVAADFFDTRGLRRVWEVERPNGPMSAPVPPTTAGAPAAAPTTTANIAWSPPQVAASSPPK